MKTFKAIREDMVNYNHTNQRWQIRHDIVGHTFKNEKSHVILKDAKPHVDHEAREGGKKVHTYLHGTPVTSVPEGHKKREIKFNADNTEHPFTHKDDNSPVIRASYVEFKGRKVHAHYKLSENFKDGRNPEDKGDMARHGLKGKSITQLMKVRSSDSASPREKQLAHWRINMTQGKKKDK